MLWFLRSPAVGMKPGGMELQPSHLIQLHSSCCISSHSPTWRKRLPAYARNLSQMFFEAHLLLSVLSIATSQLNEAILAHWIWNLPVMAHNQQWETVSTTGCALFPQQKKSACIQDLGQIGVCEGTHIFWQSFCIFKLFFVVFLFVLFFFPKLIFFFYFNNLGEGWFFSSFFPQWAECVMSLLHLLHCKGKCKYEKINKKWILNPHFWSYSK